MKLIEFCFPKIYNVAESKRHINQIRYSLYELYDDYVVAYASNNIGTSDFLFKWGGDLLIVL